MVEALLNEAFLSLLTRQRVKIKYLKVPSTSLDSYSLCASETPFRTDAGGNLFTEGPRSLLWFYEKKFYQRVGIL